MRQSAGELEQTDDVTLRREVRRLRLLAGVAGDLLRLSSPSEVIHELVGRVLPVVECEVFFNYLVDEQRPGWMKLNAWAGLDENTVCSIRDLELGAAVCGNVAQIKLPRVVGSVQETSGEETALIRNVGLRAYACFPLMAGDEVLGTLGFGSRQLDRFEKADLEFMGLVVEHIALAIERERSERRTRETEQRAQVAEWRQEQILRHAPMAVFMKDLKGRYVYCNPAELAWIGRAPNEVIGRTDFDLFPSEQAKRFAESDDLALHEPGAIDLDVSAEERPDGRGLGRAHSVMKFALRDPDGTPFAVCGIALDVTPRIQAERSAKEALERLSLAQRGGRVGIFDWLIPQDTIIWSPELELLYGIKPGHFEGKFSEWKKRVHPADAERVTGEILNAMERGLNEIDYDFRAIRPDNSEIWLQGKAVILYQTEGERKTPVRLIGVNVDITQTKRTEQQLLLARQDAEMARDLATQANLAKDHFLAVLSHELRTPLTPVLATAQLMEADAGLPVPVREAWGMVRRNINLEARLIDDLLDLTRITRGKLELQIGDVEAHEKAREVQRICEEDIRNKGVRLTMDLQAQRTQLRADGARIQQVLWNLLKNAIKFTPPGGTIAIRSRNERMMDGTESIVFEVQDSGIGISEEAMTRIFDAFEQADSAVAKQFGGLGLGLAICKALVDRHGGTIQARSNGKGLGALFRITLPLSKREVQQAAGTSSPSGDSRPGIRVLLVDDHADTARAMSRLLRSMGYVVRTAESVATGIAAWQEQPADVLVSDLGLPDGTGHDLLRTLLSRGSVKAIALSGFGMEQDLTQSREAGFAEHLTKPVDVKRLDRAIRALM